MAHSNHFNVEFGFSPKLNPGTRIDIRQSPSPLWDWGLNLLVGVSPSTAFIKQKKIQKRTMSLFAHLDTGASRTMIDGRVAEKLELVSTGRSEVNTANESVMSDHYAVDLIFLGSNLRAIQNIQIGSCKLGHFNFEKWSRDQRDPRNFGALIGRDVMSMWNIVWNGPSSTVFISD